MPPEDYESIRRATRDVLGARPQETTESPEMAQLRLKQSKLDLERARIDHQRDLLRATYNQQGLRPPTYNQEEQGGPKSDILPPQGPKLPLTRVETPPPSYPASLAVLGARMATLPIKQGIQTYEALRPVGAFLGRAGAAINAPLPPTPPGTEYPISMGGARITRPLTPTERAVQAGRESPPETRFGLPKPPAPEFYQYTLNGRMGFTDNPARIPEGATNVQGRRYESLPELGYIGREGVTLTGQQAQALAGTNLFQPIKTPEEIELQQRQNWANPAWAAREQTLAKQRGALFTQPGYERSYYEAHPQERVWDDLAINDRAYRERINKLSDFINKPLETSARYSRVERNAAVAEKNAAIATLQQLEKARESDLARGIDAYTRNRTIDVTELRTRLDELKIPSEIQENIMQAAYYGKQANVYPPGYSFIDPTTGKWVTAPSPEETAAQRNTRIGAIMKEAFVAGGAYGTEMFDPAKWELMMQMHQETPDKRLVKPAWLIPWAKQQLDEEHPEIGKKGWDSRESQLAIQARIEKWYRE